MLRKYTSASTSIFVKQPVQKGSDLAPADHSDERNSVAQEEKLLVKKMHKLALKFQQESVHLMNQISETRTRLNSTTAISRLPCDILVIIFESYVRDHWESYFPLAYLENSTSKPQDWAYSFSHRTFWEQRSPYSWIKNILHVCHGWRRVALATPQLWACITPNRLGEEWRLDFLLQHAKGVPLSIRSDGILYKFVEFDGSDNSDDPASPERSDFFRRLLQEPLRTCETIALTITDKLESILVDLENECDGSEGDQAENECNEDAGGQNEGDQHEGDANGEDKDTNEHTSVLHAPLLRNLMLDLTQRNSNDYLPMLSRFHAPSLRLLAMVEGPMDFVQRVASPSLTNLYLSFCHIVPADLLKVLESLPALQRLSADTLGSSGIPDSNHHFSRRQVSLPSLQHLKLAGSPSGITELLCELDLPIDTTIHIYSARPLSPSMLSDILPTVIGRDYRLRPRTIRIAGGAGEWRDRFSLWDGISVFFCRADPAPMASIYGDSLDAHEYTSRSRFGTPRYAKDNVPRLCLGWSVPTESCTENVVHQLLPVFDTSMVSAFTFDTVYGSNPFEQVVWGEVLRHPGFPQLKTLCVSNSLGGHGFLRAIIDLAEQLGESNTDVNDSSQSIGSDTLAASSSVTVFLTNLKRLVIRNISHQYVERDSELFTLLRRYARSGSKLEVLECRVINTRDESLLTAAQEIALQLGVADVVRFIFDD
ncbi:hypothetical protein EIP86_007443 [Pleurotus ostreatoroseus]|nr:hypothetical protein EIP86_007443 [Pleurotus ostreatoroseus]